MSRSRRPGERGYTLLELAVMGVPIALTGMLLFAIFGFAAGFSHRRVRQAAEFADAWAALAVLTRELREASALPGAVTVWSREDGAKYDGIGLLVARTADAGRPFVTGQNGLPQWQGAVYYVADDRSGVLHRLMSDYPYLSWAVPLPRGVVVARQVRGLRVNRHDDLVTVSLIIGRAGEDTLLTVAARLRN